MLGNAFLVLSALLAVVTVPVTACTNGACGVANSIYKECKYKTVTTADFKKCLCTKQFLVNYDRCLAGSVCGWNGDPATLNNPCILIYCPGTFDGGFDAKAFCMNRLVPTSLPTRTVRPPILTLDPIPIETGIA
ncbi:hypothetical protein FRC14_006352 [Serendipita sp. 396]|nr:hypothetical protein FRC14_006352 [Serendipita sp. 396]KAG8772056.1 hypothetical protein FRC15_003010 [Serendipita sp. 397]KAG8787439.1 hypothetical protein FRC16_001552 [Serendipita sp. 398]KAG8814100.1 hypothetical protein FRC18_002117 [Serendipita sp. 400]KAG8820179.1 hypothetical protein FRC19_009085 [Serendipita sp. 401]